MILTDEAALILLAILAVCVLILLVIAGAGLFLLVRGRRVTGVALIASAIGFVFVPNLIDRARNAPIAAAFEARSTLPAALDLTGQRVLFIDASETICDGFCGEVLQIGTDLEAYWVGMGATIPGEFTDNPLRDIIDAPQFVRRVALAPPLEADDTPAPAQRFAEPIPGGHAPPYDVVIVVDDSGLLSFVAPDLLGPPIPARVHVQSVILVFTDWRDPFAAPPPEPTYRSVVGILEERLVLLWPVVTRNVLTAEDPDITALWRAALCPFAGPEAARDAFTFGYMCETDSLNSLLE